MFKCVSGGTLLVVQWLGLCAFTAWVQSVVRELRSYKPCGAAKGKKKKSRIKCVSF